MGTSRVIEKGEQFDHCTWMNLQLVPVQVVQHCKMWIVRNLSGDQIGQQAVPKEDEPAIRFARRISEAKGEQLAVQSHRGEAGEHLVFGGGVRGECSKNRQIAEKLKIELDLERGGLFDRQMPQRPTAGQLCELFIGARSKSSVEEVQLQQAPALCQELKQQKRHNRHVRSLTDGHLAYVREQRAEQLKTISRVEQRSVHLDVVGLVDRTVRADLQTIGLSIVRTDLDQ